HVITSILVMNSRSAYRLKQHCSDSKSVSKAVCVDPGISLGVDMEAVRKLKGAPSKELSNLLLYEYQTIEQTAVGPADVVSSLELRFTDKKLSQFFLSKIESY